MWASAGLLRFQPSSKRSAPALVRAANTQRSNVVMFAPTLDSRRQLLLAALMVPAALQLGAPPRAAAARLRAQTADEKAAFANAMDTLFNDTGEFRPDRYVRFANLLACL